MGRRFWDVFIIMAVLAAFAIPGYLLRKFHLLHRVALPTLANVLLYVCLPAMTVKAFCLDPIEPSGRVAVNMLIVTALTAVGTLALFGIGKLVFSKWKDRVEADIYTFVGTFGNCSFIGVPFVDMLSGGDSAALMYTITFSIAFNLLLWTLGVYLVTGDRKAVRLRRAFLNPASIAVAFSLLLFYVPAINFFEFPLFAPLRQIPASLGYMTAPLSMMIVGARLVDINPRTLFCKAGVYYAGIIRLAVAPLVMLALVLPLRALGCFGADFWLWAAPVIGLSMSPAATVSAFAEKSGRGEEIATAAFVNGTLLGIVTIPVLMVVLELFV